MSEFHLTPQFVTPVNTEIYLFPGTIIYEAYQVDSIVQGNDSTGIIYAINN